MHLVLAGKGQPNLQLCDASRQAACWDEGSFKGNCLPACLLTGGTGAAAMLETLADQKKGVESFLGGLGAVASGLPQDKSKRWLGATPTNCLRGFSQLLQGFGQKQ